MMSTTDLVSQKELKRELKQWEAQFYELNQRKPDKKDISSNIEIAKKYKLYGKLKQTTASSTPSANVNTPAFEHPSPSGTSPTARNNTAIIDPESQEISSSSEGITQKTQLGLGPIAKTNLADANNRFLNRIQQKEKSPDTLENIIVKSGNVEASTPTKYSEMDAFEVESFLSRKREIQALQETPPKEDKETKISSIKEAAKITAVKDSVIPTVINVKPLQDSNSAKSSKSSLNDRKKKTSPKTNTAHLPELPKRAKTPEKATVPPKQSWNATSDEAAEATEVVVNTEKSQVAEPEAKPALVNIYPNDVAPPKPIGQERSDKSSTISLSKLPSLQLESIFKY